MNAGVEAAANLIRRLALYGLDLPYSPEAAALGLGKETTAVSPPKRRPTRTVAAPGRHPSSQSLRENGFALLGLAPSSTRLAGGRCLSFRARRVSGSIAGPPQRYSKTLGRAAPIVAGAVCGFST